MEVKTGTMEVKNELVFSVKKQDDRIYKFTIPTNAPLGESFAAAVEFRDKVVELINEHIKKQKQAEKPKEIKKEEVKEESSKEKK